jgi:hypothetical protein
MPKSTISRKAQRARGYRIYGRSHDWQLFDTGVTFLTAAPDDFWNAVTADSHVRYAVLYRSGRKFREYRAG